MPENLNALAETIKQDVEIQSVKALKDAPRTHLGASIIGHKCNRYIWQTFRWIHQEKFNGRMYRLFNRGHLEEHRFVERLRGIGFKVTDIDPRTGKQMRIENGYKGHYGGSLDSVGIAPEHYGLTEPLLLEFKTHNDKSFKKLLDKRSVRAVKPEHYSQMSEYGAAFGLTLGLYCAVNKNDDDLYFEVVRLSHSEHSHMQRRAQEIIDAQIAPARLSETSSYFDCKYCHFSGHCFENFMPEKNCRSCRYAVAVDNGQWECARYNAIIPPDFIPKACDDWLSIL